MFGLTGYVWVRGTLVFLFFQVFIFPDFLLFPGFYFFSQVFLRYVVTQCLLYLLYLLGMFDFIGYMVRWCFYFSRFLFFQIFLRYVVTHCLLYLLYLLGMFGFIGYVWLYWVCGTLVSFFFQVFIFPDFLKVRRNTLFIIFMNP